LRNISDWNINNAINQISDKEYDEKLIRLCKRKIDFSKEFSNKTKDKIIRSLRYKGWELDKIITSINQLTK